MPVNRIELIAHPLYFFLNRIDMLQKAAKRGSPRDPTYLTPKEKLLIKNQLHKLGNVIREVKKNPNAIVVIVETPGDSNTSWLSKSMQRFKSFVRTEMGESKSVFLESKFGFTGEGKQAVLKARERLAQIDFDKNVTINAMGDYLESCVETSGKRLKSILRRNGVNSTVHIKNNTTYSMLELLSAKTGFSRFRRQKSGKRPTKKRNRPI